MLALLLLWACSQLDQPCNQSADCGTLACVVRDECGGYPLCVQRCVRDLDCASGRACGVDGFCSTSCLGDEEPVLD